MSEQINIEQKVLDNKSVLLDWLEDKTNQIMLTTKAREFQRMFEGWFHLKRFMTKTNKGIEESLQLLNLLKLSGNLVARIHHSGKYEEYKIVLNPTSKLYVLKHELERHMKSIEEIESELGLLKTVSNLQVNSKVKIPTHFLPCTSTGCTTSIDVDNLHQVDQYVGKIGTICYLQQETEDEPGFMKVVVEYTETGVPIIMGGYFSKNVPFNF